MVEFAKGQPKKIAADNLACLARDQQAAKLHERVARLVTHLCTWSTSDLSNISCTYERPVHSGHQPRQIGSPSIS